MDTGNYIIIGVAVVVVAAIIVYLVKQKKKGVKCIGCPYGRSCGGNCGGTQKIK